MLTFNHLPSSHFVEDISEIWYPGTAMWLLAINKAF